MCASASKEAELELKLTRLKEEWLYCDFVLCVRSTGAAGSKGEGGSAKGSKLSGKNTNGGDSSKTTNGGGSSKSSGVKLNSASGLSETALTLEPRATAEIISKLEDCQVLLAALLGSRHNGPFKVCALF